MSNARSALAIDLNLIDENGTQATLAPAAELPQNNMPQAGPGMSFVGPSDGSPSFIPAVQGSPQFAPMMVGAGSPQYVPITTTLGSPSFVDPNSTLCYATPQYTPTFLTTSVGGLPSNQFDSPYLAPTPDMYGTPVGYQSFGIQHNAETPMYNYQRGYRNGRRDGNNMAVSCRVHNVVKRVRSYCVKNDIEMIKVVEGKNVMKVSVRSVMHTQKLESALTNIVQGDEIEVEAVSLPESIDVTKRKRGFLLFMKLKNFEKDEKQVRKRFAETGLDYKITLVDGLTLSANNKSNKSGVDDLRKQVELLKLEVERLKQSPSHDELKAEL